MVSFIFDFYRSFFFVFPISFRCFKWFLRVILALRLFYLYCYFFGIRPGLSGGGSLGAAVLVVFSTSATSGRRLRLSFSSTMNTFGSSLCLLAPLGWAWNLPRKCAETPNKRPKKTEPSQLPKNRGSGPMVFPKKMKIRNG